MDGADAIVNEVNLSPTAELVADGLRQDLPVQTGDVGLDRHPILGRCLDHGQISDTGQGHMQGARDGSGGHGHTIHLLAELLHSLLVPRPEALLFVDHQKAEVLELDVFGKESMGSDHHVDLTGGELLHDRLLLLGRPEAGEHLHSNGKRREARSKRLEVLERQYRGGHQHGYLLSVHDRLEGGAHRYFRLPVANVPAQEPIHGVGGLHVALDLRDGLHLIRCFLVLEEILQLALPVSIWAKGVPGDRLASGVKAEELLRHVPHGLSDSPFDSLPPGASQLIDARPLCLRARVLLEQIDLVHRYIELVSSQVLENDELFATRTQLSQSREDANAVVGMNHIVPDFQVPEIGQKAAQFARAPELRPRRLVEDVSTRKHRLTEPRKEKTMGKGAEMESDGPGWVGSVGSQCAGNLRLLENLDHAFG